MEKDKCVYTVLVRTYLFVNQHHCTKEYFHLAPPIFLYAKVDSAGGRWRGWTSSCQRGLVFFLKVVSVTNGICLIIFYQYSTTCLAVDLVSTCSILGSLSTAAPLLGKCYLRLNGLIIFLFILTYWNVLIKCIQNDVKWNFQFGSSVTKCKCVYNFEYVFEVNDLWEMLDK